ncbi:MAG: hypothetical protein ACI87T_000231, partial [Planctomycetota bacterium]
MVGARHLIGADFTRQCGVEMNKASSIPGLAAAFKTQTAARPGS